MCAPAVGGAPGVAESALAKRNRGRGRYVICDRGSAPLSLESRVACENTASFSSVFKCLSGAYLGNVIVFTLKWCAKKAFFAPLIPNCATNPGTTRKTAMSVKNPTETSSRNRATPSGDQSDRSSISSGPTLDVHTTTCTSGALQRKAIVPPGSGGSLDGAPEALPGDGMKELTGHQAADTAAARHVRSMNASTSAHPHTRWTHRRPLPACDGVAAAAAAARRRFRCSSSAAAAQQTSTTPQIPQTRATSE